MIIDNKFEKIFGPSGTFAGYMLIIAGLITLLKGFGIILILLGAFVSFSVSGTMLNTENRKIKYYTNLFGIFKSGKWNDLDLFREIVVRRSNRNYRTYSRSNRTLDIKQTDYRIFLITSDHRKKVPLKKFKNLDDARTEAEKFSQELNMPFVK